MYTENGTRHGNEYPMKAPIENGNHEPLLNGDGIAYSSLNGEK